MKSLVSPSYLVKERHFFDRFYTDEFRDEHIAAYHAWFPRQGDMTTGEWTPRYLVDYWVSALLKMAAPKAKLLVMLRDPVERYASGMAHVRRTNPHPPPHSALEHCMRGLYHQQLAQWLNHFDRSALLVLQYERCMQSPEAELEKTFAFLQLDFGDYEFDPKLVAKRTNVTPPDTLFHLTEDHRRSLIERYTQEVRQLATEFPEIDLSLWPNFR